MNEETKRAILDLAEKVDVLQPFQVKAELIRIIQTSDDFEVITYGDKQLKEMLNNHNQGE